MAQFSLGKGFRHHGSELVLELLLRSVCLPPHHQSPLDSSLPLCAPLDKHVLGLAGGLVAFVLFAVIYIVDCISCGGAVFGGTKKKTKTSSSKSKPPDANLQAV